MFFFSKVGAFTSTTPSHVSTSAVVKIANTLADEIEKTTKIRPIIYPRVFLFSLVFFLILFLLIFFKVIAGVNGRTPQSRYKEIDFASIPFGTQSYAYLLEDELPLTEEQKQQYPSLSRVFLEYFNLI